MQQFWTGCEQRLFASQSFPNSGNDINMYSARSETGGDATQVAKHICWLRSVDAMCGVCDVFHHSVTLFFSVFMSGVTKTSGSHPFFY